MSKLLCNVVEISGGTNAPNAPLVARLGLTIRYSFLVSGLGHCVWPILSDTSGHGRSFLKLEYGPQQFE